jgi:putative nucleotidyltransferase with HDIG domain
VTDTRKSKTSTKTPQPVKGMADEVVSDLQQTRDHVETLIERVDREAQKAAAAQHGVELDTARSERRDEQLKKLREELREERSRATWEHERAERLAHAVAELHRSVFHGNVYDLILQASVRITQGTAGVYVTILHDGGNVIVRSTVGLDHELSPFLKELCAQVVHTDHAIVCNSQEELGGLQGLPKPGDGDRFHNLIAVPAVVLKDRHGVVIVVNKQQGTFDERDTEALLHVGAQASIAVENVRLRRELQRAYLLTMATLADAMEVKDPSTHGHCDLVSQYARRIAEHLKLSKHEQSVVSHAALLHDIGKIGVSDGVLNKPGSLLPEETQLVRSHVRIGHDLLNRVPALEPVADAVLHHHEWYDGSGYPDGLKGETIPLAARIVSVVDAYAAMVTVRSYKSAYSDSHARSELERCSGSQFDPRIVKIFLQILDAGEPSAPDEEDEREFMLFPGYIEEQETAV